MIKESYVVTNSASHKRGGNSLLLRWDSNLETGIEIIDQQHRNLVNLVNLLAHALIHCEPGKIADIFADLADYATYHFETEENIWRKYFGDDTWLREHSASHQNFLPSIERIRKQHDGEALNEQVEPIFRFLVRWIVFHILEDDKKLASAVLAVQKGLDISAAKALATSRASQSYNVFVDTLLNMHDQLTSKTLTLLREQEARDIAEQKLRQANKKLELLSVTDQLTGLYNRRHFDEILKKEIRRARRQTQSLSLIFLDVDDFKKLNDHYGHSRGDEALRTLALLLTNVCQRSTDFAFRIGGEEFAVILAHTPEEKARLFAENLRTQVEALNFANEQSRAGRVLTISLGVYCQTPGASDNADTFMQYADTALYQAKEEGRNRVRVFSTANP